MKSTDQFSTFGRRVLAAFFDWGFLYSVFGLITYLCSLAFSATTYILYTIIMAIAVFGYAILLTYILGGTFGKRLFDLMVVDAKNLAKVSLFQSIRREILTIGFSLYAIFVLIYMFENQGPQALMQYFTRKSTNSLLRIQSSLSALLAVAELVTCLFSAKRRAIHDLIAGTVIVKNKTVKWYFVLITILMFIIGIVVLAKTYGLLRSSALIFLKTMPK